MQTKLFFDVYATQLFNHSNKATIKVRAYLSTVTQFNR